MARARNIKPAFFDNDELADNDPLGRLLFIGLWTLADCNGNLEWRAKRIKKQILAYDDCCIESLAINLDKSGFVRFYSDGEKMYLNVINFEKHQNPHKNEKSKGSEIPDYCDEYRQVVDLNKLAINHDLSRGEPEDSSSNPADSLNLIPDSLNLIPDSRKEAKPSSAKANNELLEIFNYWKDVMKKSNSAILNAKRSKAVKARLKEGYSVEQIKQAIEGCAMTPHNMGQNQNGKKYDDLELICRDGVQVERFANNATQQQPRFGQHVSKTLDALNNMEWDDE